MDVQQQMASKGGAARAAALSTGRRLEIAMEGVNARREKAMRREMTAAVKGIVGAGGRPKDYEMLAEQFVEIAKRWAPKVTK